MRLVLPSMAGLPLPCADLVMTDTYRNRPVDYAGIAAALVPSGYAAVFTSSTDLPIAVASLTLSGLTLCGLCVWTWGQRRTNQCAPILIAQKPPRLSSIPIDLWIPSSEDNTQYYPNIPAPEVVGALIERLTRPMQVVLDPDMRWQCVCDGAERTGRTFIGIKES